MNLSERLFRDELRTMFDLFMFGEFGFFFFFFKFAFQITSKVKHMILPTN